MPDKNNQPNINNDIDDDKPMSASINIKRLFTAQKNKKKLKHKLNPDKVALYLKEYVNNGFNKRKAYRQVGAKELAQGTVSTYGCNFHKRITSNLQALNISLDKYKDFDTSKVSPAYIIARITEIAENPNNSDRIKLLAYQLLGQFRGLWHESKSITHTVIYTQAERDEAESIRSRLSTEFKGRTLEAESSSTE